MNSNAIHSTCHLSEARCRQRIDSGKLELAKNLRVGFLEGCSQQKKL